LIASAKKTLTGSIPNGKSEISQQVVNTIICPDGVSAENEFGIWGFRDIVMSVGFQFRDQAQPRVDAAIRYNPSRAIQAKRLAFMFGFRTNFEQRVAEADIPIDPDALRVWTAEFLKVH
jgi:hypothetical protein